jgi:membrane-bound ClpP family serine protease
MWIVYVLIGLVIGLLLAGTVLGHAIWTTVKWAVVICLVGVVLVAAYIAAGEPSMVYIMTVVAAVVGIVAVIIGSAFLYDKWGQYHPNLPVTERLKALGKDFMAWGCESTKEAGKTLLIIFATIIIFGILTPILKYFLE